MGYLPHDVCSWLRANQATVTRLSAPWNALHKSYDVTSKLVKPISLIQVKAGIDMFVLRAAASTRRFPDAGLWTNNNRPMKPIIQDSNHLAIHPRDWLPSVVAPLTLSQRTVFVQASLIRNRSVTSVETLLDRLEQFWTVCHSFADIHAQVLSLLSYILPKRTENRSRNERKQENNEKRKSARQWAVRETTKATAKPECAVTYRSTERRSTIWKKQKKKRSHNRRAMQQARSLAK